MTVEAFLSWERRQDMRYEFDGTGIVAMNGGTLNHSRIASNLARALDRRLVAPCEAWRGDVKILVDGRVRYPDVVVSCSPADGTAGVLPNPVVVFEVLPPGTASIDRLVKNAEYRATPSIQRYVMVEPGQIGATVFSRDGDRWHGLILIGDAVLAMPEIGVEIPLPELYVGIELPPTDTDD